MLRKMKALSSLDSVLKYVSTTRLPRRDVRMLSSQSAGVVEGVDRHLLNQIECTATKKRSQLGNIKRFKDVELGSITVQTALGGMRGTTALLCDTSQLDPYQGIRFRGYAIDHLCEVLPSAVEGSGVPLPEGLLHLLLTGDLPSKDDVALLQREISKRAMLDKHVLDAVSQLPRTAHPMAQLITGITACQTSSVFADTYKKGVAKDELWKAAIEDALGVIAKVPIIAAHVYRRTFSNDDFGTLEYKEDVDWAANLAIMLGYDNPEFFQCMRLYMFLHADHEGGNVSAHASHLVASALSDPYLSLAAGLSGLAGPLHGLANQECLNFLLAVQKHHSDNNVTPTKESVINYAKQHLAKGRVIPGFGHAVLRVVDPRFTAQQKFANKYMSDYDLLQLLNICAEAIPEVLSATGKVSNPYPNVDAHSGVLLSRYGMTQASYYTVLFGVSRTLGLMSQLVWDRIFGLPIERPKSVSLEYLEDVVQRYAQAPKPKTNASA